MKILISFVFCLLSIQVVLADPPCDQKLGIPLGNFEKNLGAVVEKVILKDDKTPMDRPIGIFDGVFLFDAQTVDDGIEIVAEEGNALISSISEKELKEITRLKNLKLVDLIKELKSNTPNLSPHGKLILLAAAGSKAQDDNHSSLVSLAHDLGFENGRGTGVVIFQDPTTKEYYVQRNGKIVNTHEKNGAKLAGVLSHSEVFMNYQPRVSRWVDQQAQLDTSEKAGVLIASTKGEDSISAMHEMGKLKTLVFHSLPKNNSDFTAIDIIGTSSEKKPANESKSGSQEDGPPTQLLATNQLFMNLGVGHVNLGQGTSKMLPTGSSIQSQPTNGDKMELGTRFNDQPMETSAGLQVVIPNNLGANVSASAKQVIEGNVSMNGVGGPQDKPITSYQKIDLKIANQPTEKEALYIENTTSAIFQELESAGVKNVTKVVVGPMSLAYEGSAELVSKKDISPFKQKIEASLGTVLGSAKEKWGKLTFNASAEKNSYVMTGGAVGGAAPSAPTKATPSAPSIGSSPQAAPTAPSMQVTKDVEYKFTVELTGNLPDGRKVIAWVKGLFQ